MPYASKKPLPQICLKITRDIEKAFILVQRDGEKNSKYYNYFNMLGRADQETLKYAPIGKNRVVANNDLLPLKFVYPLYTYLELIKEEKLIDHELYEKDLKQVVSGSNVIFLIKIFICKTLIKKGESRRYTTGLSRETMKK